MSTRAFSVVMLVFSIGLVGGDWIWCGIERVQEMLPLRVAMGLEAVVLFWAAKRLRHNSA